jgi:RNA-directed DNA polymerase
MSIGGPAEKKEGWYKARNYPHFDVPLPFDAAKAYVTNPTKVARHPFYPFLAFELTHRRYKGGDKVRPIKMAAHLDGYIFAYYAKLLSDACESRVAGTPLAQSVIAYRTGLGSNIGFAEDAFREVEKRKNCAAIALDIKSFFDSISHEHLKQSWCKLIGKPKLPPDQYAVFKAVTRYAVVDRDSCWKELGFSDQTSVQRPLCSAMDFRTQIRDKGLVKPHTLPLGIPQGSQISAILSNVYMLPFDERMCALATLIGDYYRRYSDDILWICDVSDQALVAAEINNALSDLGKGLKINGQKTVISVFEDLPGGGIRCIGRPLQYLGFEFDGQKRLVRGSTVSRYWKKVILGIRATKRKAREAERDGGNPVPFRRAIYRRYTHLARLIHA